MPPEITAAQLYSRRIDLQRQADHSDQRQLARSRQHLLQRRHGSVQQRLLMEQILARVSGQTELGKHREHGVPLRGLVA